MMTHLNRWYLAKIQSALLFIILEASRTTGTIARAKIHPCQPYRVLVETAQNDLLLFPAYVEVTRCAGGYRPSKYQCQPRRTEKLKFCTKIASGQEYVIEVKNHTECVEVCVCGRCSGSSVAAKAICEDPLIWDRQTCSCEKVFCPLQKQEHSDNQKEERGKNMSYSTVSILLAVELVAMVASIVVWKRCSRYRKQQRTSNHDGDKDNNHRVSYNSFVG